MIWILDHFITLDTKCQKCVILQLYKCNMYVMRSRYLLIKESTKMSDKSKKYNNVFYAVH